MALRFIDSFDAYGPVGTDSDDLWTRMSGKWDIIYNNSDPEDFQLADGVESGQALQMDNGNQHIIGKVFDNQSRWILGFYWKASYLGLTNEPFIRIRDGNDLQIEVEWQSTNGLRLEADGVNIGSTGTLNINQWYLMELDVTFKTDATGTCKLWIDEVLVVNGSNVVTSGSGNNYAQDIRIYGAGLTPVITIDDVYMADGTDGVNSPVGFMKVETSFPTSDSTPSDWTTSTGVDHYALVSDTTRDTTDYVHTDVNAEEDMFNFTAPTEDSILGIQLCVEAASSGSEIKEFKSIIRHSGNDSTTSANLMAGPNTPTTILTLSDYQVGTTTAWTGATIAAADFGCEKVS